MSHSNSRYLNIGPGGRCCNCCFPAPGSKDRRAQFRSAKHKAERAAWREIEQECADAENDLLQMQADAFEDDYDDAFEEMRYLYDDDYEEMRYQDDYDDDYGYNYVGDYS